MNTFFKENGMAVSSGRRLALRAGVGLAAGLTLPLTNASDWKRIQEEPKQGIKIVESVEAYNFEQWKQTYLTPLVAEHQGDTNTCVLHQIQATQRILKHPVITRNGLEQLMGKSEDVILPDAFRAVGIAPLVSRDGVYSYIRDAIRKPKDDFDSNKNNWILDTPFDDLSPAQLIELGVNMGHIVILSVEAQVLHAAFAKRYYPGVAYTAAQGPHAVRVIGLKKKYRNTIVDTVIYDSSCPNRNEVRYAIGFDVLMEAYRGINIKNVFASGVYITQAKPYPSIVELY